MNEEILTRGEVVGGGHWGPSKGNNLPQGDRVSSEGALGTRIFEMKEKNPPKVTEGE